MGGRSLAGVPWSMVAPSGAVLCEDATAAAAAGDSPPFPPVLPRGREVTVLQQPAWPPGTPSLLRRGSTVIRIDGGGTPAVRRVQGFPALSSRVTTVRIVQMRPAWVAQYPTASAGHDLALSACWQVTWRFGVSQCQCPRIFCFSCACRRRRHGGPRRCCRHIAPPPPRKGAEDSVKRAVVAGGLSPSSPKNGSSCI